jgi:hypothetical protein
LGRGYLEGVLDHSPEAKSVPAPEPEPGLQAAPPGGGVPQAAGGSHEHRWLILAVVGIAQLMVVLDATIVNIALPSAQKDLGFTNGNRQWVVTAYALAFGSLLLLGGRIADLAGRKAVFLAGLAGFALASALGGAATSFGMLVGPVPSRGCSARRSRRPPSRSSRRRSRIRASAPRRSASTAPSRARAARWGCSWAACSPSIWTGAGACT